MPRLKITVSYTGTAFCGWQLQAVSPDIALRRPAQRTEQRSVQGELEAAVGRLVSAPVRVHGAGRTDSGVHADAQVAHFDIPENKLGLDWQYALNCLLPKDVSVVRVEQVAESFHSRFDATAKSYIYRLWLSRRFLPPAIRPFVWETGPLDFFAMREAAAHMLGEHDFAAMQNHGMKLENTVRNMMLIQANPENPELAESDCPESFLNIQSYAGYIQSWHFKGDGFLKQMVRNMMGLLCHVGLGKVNPEAVPDILASCDRRMSAVTAPARGLSLSRVYY